MFGINQDTLVKALDVLRLAHCAYLTQKRGDQCDCKYGVDKSPFDSLGWKPKISMGEDGCGCPELAMAAYMIEAMTPKEFDRICKRAKILIIDKQLESIT